jgi:hypothetical protein
MADFNIYALGGTGIKIVNNYINTGSQLTEIANIIGLDTSSANKSHGNSYEIERLEGGIGSGSDKSANMKKYSDFVKHVLAKHPANKCNILVYSLGGGSGSGIGPHMVKQLIQKDLPVICVIIGDMSSVLEQDNTIKTLGSLYNQCKILNENVIVSYLENKPNLSHGEVNNHAKDIIDMCIVMFNLNNDSIDESDIKNFFFYNRIVNADPVISNLSFLKEEDLKNYNRKPVAAISLFDDPNKVKAPFENLLYRKGGIFADKFKGVEKSVHAVLDHGDVVKDLQAMFKQQESRNDELSGRFKIKENINLGQADDDGMLS